jgi:hypothetical protein
MRQPLPTRGVGEAIVGPPSLTHRVSIFVKIERANPNRVRWATLRNALWRFSLESGLPRRSHLTTWTDWGGRTEDVCKLPAADLAYTWTLKKRRHSVRERTCLRGAKGDVAVVADHAALRNREQSCDASSRSFHRGRPTPTLQRREHSRTQELSKRTEIWARGQKLTTFSGN